MTTSDQTIDPRTDVLEVLQRLFSAEAAYIERCRTGRARFDELADCLDPEVVMHQAASLPYGGSWRGHEGFERFIIAMSSVWQSLEFLEQRFVIGGDSVVVHNRGRLQARSTGRMLETEVMQLMTMRDGRVAEIRPFYLDTAAVLDTLAMDH